MKSEKQLEIKDVQPIRSKEKIEDMKWSRRFVKLSATLPR